MKRLDAVLVLLLGLLLGVGYWAAYNVGVSQGHADVINSCNWYGRYEVPATPTRINCVGPFEPEAWPSVEDLNEKMYTKENKDKHKKDRK